MAWKPQFLQECHQMDYRHAFCNLRAKGTRTSTNPTFDGEFRTVFCCAFLLIAMSVQLSGCAHLSAGLQNCTNDSQSNVHTICAQLKLKLFCCTNFFAPYCKPTNSRTLRCCPPQFFLWQLWAKCLQCDPKLQPWTHLSSHDRYPQRSIEAVTFDPRLIFYNTNC